MITENAKHVLGSIQTATEGDVDRLTSFFNHRQIKKELNQFTYSKTLERAIRREDREIFYLESDEVLVAGLMVWCESSVLKSEEAQIRLIAVHPSYRRHGYGRLLVSRAINFARKWDKDFMIADTLQKQQSISFWKSCGFGLNKEWETKNGTKMARMQKNLDRLYKEA